MALLLLKPVTAGCDHLARGCCPEDRPSPLFLGFAVLLNGPAAAYALAAGVGQASSGCDDRLHTFLFVAAGVNAAMIAFAIYLYRKFSRPYSRHDPDDSGPWARASDICLNDPGAALFILVFIFSAVWANLGLGWARRGGCEARELTQAVRLVGSLMNVFLLVGAGVMLFSLGVESCRHYDRQGGMFQDFWGGPPNFAERESSARGRGQSRVRRDRWVGAGNTRARLAQPSSLSSEPLPQQVHAKLLSGRFGAQQTRPERPRLPSRGWTRPVQVVAPAMPPPRNPRRRILLHHRSAPACSGRSRLKLRKWLSVFQCGTPPSPLRGVGQTGRRPRRNTRQISARAPRPLRARSRHSRRWGLLEPEPQRVGLVRQQPLTSGRSAFSRPSKPRSRRRGWRRSRRFWQ